MEVTTRPTMIWACPVAKNWYLYWTVNQDSYGHELLPSVTPPVIDEEEKDETAGKMITKEQSNIETGKHDFFTLHLLIWSHFV